MAGKKERILYFDLIKLVATLCVFICHFTRTLESHGVGFDFKLLPDNVFTVYLGSFGVSLFFIVSGAALMYVYDEKIDVKNYLIRRFKGIYPLFWLTYIIAFFIMFYKNAGMNHGIPKYRIIYSILGCDGNVQFFQPTFYLVGEWFLSVIILLYVVFPLARIAMKKWPVIVWILSVGIFALCYLVWDSVLPLDCFFIARLPEFLFGMLFVKVIKKPKVWLAVPGAAILLGSVLFESRFLQIDHIIRTEIIGIATFCVLSFVLQWFKGDFITRLSKFIDQYTYGFFLSHHFIQTIVLEKFVGTYLTRADIILACCLCLIVTILSTLWLQRINKMIMNCFKKESKVDK